MRDSSRKPSNVEIFALYHLGLDRSGVYRFRNLSDCARVYGVDPSTFMTWLSGAQLDPDMVGTVEFNMAKWHAEAQFVAATDAERLIAEAHAGYGEALRRRKPGTFFHAVDYDDIWGDN